MALDHGNPWAEHREPKWLKTNIDSDSGTIDYVGSSLKANPSTSAGEFWWIEKLTWNAAGTIPTKIEGPFRGNWDERTTMTEWE